VANAYPLVGGTRQCHFAGTNLEPRKLAEKAARIQVGCTLGWAVFGLKIQYCLVIFSENTSGQTKSML
jgi:hypothetical protein